MVLICFNAVLLSQNKLPREYVPPEELVSFNSDIELATALDLLSEYSIQYLQKPIYDPQKHSGTIGIDIRSLPWKKALGLILSRTGLWYVEKPRYFEIISAAEMETSLTGQSGIKLGSDVTLKPNSREVKIETIFFEGNRKAISEIGIDWSTFYRGKVNINANQAGALQITDDIFSLNAMLPKSLIGVDVDVLLKAFDSNNLGKVLAQPQVVVTEGNEGSIQVGQDFSIKTRDFAGNVIDKFFSTGTILNVTPYIIQNNDQNDSNKGPTIFLKVHVERSTAHPDVVSTVINKSQANSYLQLFDGEETIIAGLYSTEKIKIRKGIPILKNLPWWFFGFPYIFGYNHSEETEKELVIIIKASLLKNVYDRQKLSKADVINLKSSLVKNSDLQFQKQLPQPEQLIMNENNKFQASNTSVITYDFNENYNNSSNATQYKNTKKSTNSLHKYRLGKITKIKKQFAFIQWFQSCDADELYGKKLPVVRKDNSNQKMDPIGYVKIVETRNNCIRSIIHGNNILYA